ncbi:MAG: hypothetical protein R3B90_15035 [Planctomycetaceae bacterium]
MSSPICCPRPTGNCFTAPQSGLGAPPQPSAELGQAAITPQQQPGGPAGPVQGPIIQDPASLPGGVPALGQPIETRQLILDPANPATLAYFSPRLGARFIVEQMFLPQFGAFVAVRLVSQPEPGSPLLQLGLQPGDVITRLDGLRADNLAELERHILQTSVRYIRTGTDCVHEDVIFIQPDFWFRDPLASRPPVCNHTCPLGNGYPSLASPK